MNGRSVVVTGFGCVSPLGIGVDATWEGLVSGRSGVGRPTGAGLPCPAVGAVGGDLGVATKRLDRYAALALVAAREAWASAGLPAEPVADPMAGVVLGTAHGGVATYEEELARHGDRGKVSPFTIPKFLPNMAAGVVSIELGLTGIALAPTSACAAGNHAIGEGARLVAEGRLDRVVAGSADAALTPLALAGYAAARALSRRADRPERASRPFDRDRDGFVPAEGAAVLILEAEEVARARRGPILGRVLGYGFSADAFHITSPSPDGLGAIRSMERALADAGLAPGAVDYVSPHGTSTVEGDRAEANALRSFFGPSGPPASSVKGALGHTLGAAAAIEAVVCLRAIALGVVPPTLHCDEPDPECPLDCVPGEARAVDVAVALSNAFGFGGTNATLVLGRA